MLEEPDLAGEGLTDMQVGEPSCLASSGKAVRQLAFPAIPATKRVAFLFHKRLPKSLPRLAQPDIRSAPLG